MGFHPHTSRSLGADSNHLPPARLHGIRTVARWTPSDQCAVSCSEFHPSIPGVATDDRGTLAECFCGSGVCHPPLASGIGSLGLGAGGRDKRLLFHADAVGLHALRAKQKITQHSRPPWQHCGGGTTLSHQLHTGLGFLRSGPVVQDHVGDAAVCVAAAGLLAFKTLHASHFTQRSIHPPLHHTNTRFASGKGSLPVAEHRWVCDDHSSTKKCVCEHSGHTLPLAGWQRLGFLC